MPSQLCSRTQHPRNGFNMIRFTVKLPHLSAVEDDYEGDNRNEDDHDNNDEHDAIASSPQLQLFELCFHEPFVPDDSRPISLHFDSLGPESILQYPSTLVIPTPSPPAYIHEVPEVMDLTTAALSLPGSMTAPTATTTTTTIPPIADTARLRPRGSGLSPVAVVIILALVAVIIGLFALLASSGVWISFDTGSWRRPFVLFKASDGTLYTFNRTAGTAPLELTSRLLPVLWLRASSAESLLYHMSRVDQQNPRVLLDLEDATTETCRRASALLSLRQAAFSLDPNHDVALVCYALHERIKHARTLWSNVYRHAHGNFFDRPLRGLQRASVRLRWSDGAEPAQQLAALVAAYRDLLFDRDAPELGAQCIRCSPDTNKSPLDEDPGDWHFACDSSFRSTLTTIANPLAAAANLRDWALRQSRRRLALLRKPTTDVDGEPLFPNNQHPYHEADDVMETKLPMEDDFNALTRHVLELSQGLRDLVAVLDGHGLRVAPDNSSPLPPAETNAPTPRHRWYQWSTAQEASTPSDAETSLYNSTARLLGIDDGFLDPLIRELAQASAYGMLACEFIADFFQYADALEKGRGWTALQPRTVPWDNDPSRHVTELLHNRFSPNLESESDLAKQEAEVLASALRRVREYTRPPHPVAETPAADSSTQQTDEEDRDFMRRIGARFQNPVLASLAEMIGGQHAGRASSQETSTSTNENRIG